MNASHATVTMTDASPPPNTPGEWQEGSSPASTVDSQGSKTSKNGKVLLTEEEKTARHTLAEQRRRSKIFTSYYEVTKVVPGTAAQEKSEVYMLDQTYAFLTAQLAEREKLIAEIRKLGGSVEDIVGTGQA